MLYIQHTTFVKSRGFQQSQESTLSHSELVGRAVRKEVYQQRFEALNDEYNPEEDIVDISCATAEEITN